MLPGTNDLAYLSGLSVSKKKLYDIGHRLSRAALLG